MKKNIELSVGVLKSICKSCGEVFDDYGLSDFAYGERLLLTEDGIDYAYVNCFEDKVFNEINEIVKKLFKKGNGDQAECFNRVLGLACDLINGKRIDATRKDKSCNKCGSEKLETTYYEPPKTAKISIPILTYDEWERKTSEEKEAFIANALKEKGCL
ncbi:MAG TPA: hypothetical protein VHY08_13710 [Bacillota bacterium]|nr:hypothetical protein [Bacillota bacterium]